MAKTADNVKMSTALVDDDPLVLKFLGQLLRESEIDVMWTATDAQAALHMLSRSQQLPDVLAIDIRMPGTDGFDLTRRVLDGFSDLKVIMLTSIEDPDSMLAALKVGAVGYLVKTDPPDRIVLGLRAAAKGLLPLSSVVPFPLPALGARPEPRPSPLTQREHEVLELMSRSFTNGQIARRLQISSETVKNHVTAILRKLEVPDRMGAVMWGVRHGAVH